MSKDVNGMGRSEAQRRADEKYRKQHLDYITVRTRKDERIRDLVNMASEKNGTSSNFYMIDAIKSQLDHDGITIDMLPTNTKYTPQLETPAPKRYLVYMVTEKILDDLDEEFDFIFNPEEYVSVFQTLKAAKDYIANKFKRKAHPEQWAYTIYGRSFETKNKRDAYDAYRQMAYDANSIVDGPLEDGDMIPDFIQLMEEKQKPEYVEVIKYEDINEYGEDN